MMSEDDGQLAMHARPISAQSSSDTPSDSGELEIVSYKGCGKSSVIAYLSERRRQHHPLESAGQERASEAEQLRVARQRFRELSAETDKRISAHLNELRRMKQELDRTERSVDKKHTEQRLRAHGLRLSMLASVITVDVGLFGLTMFIAQARAQWFLSEIQTGLGLLCLLTLSVVLMSHLLRKGVEAQHSLKRSVWKKSIAAVDHSITLANGGSRYRCPEC
jgi:hypothetical protein